MNVLGFSGGGGPSKKNLNFLLKPFSADDAINSHLFIDEIHGREGAKAKANRQN